jgi:hypothetical protein
MTDASTQTWTDWIALRGDEQMTPSAVVEVLEDVVAALDEPS